MVELAANFTTTSQSSPSVLEIIAEESLYNALYPALHRIVESVDPVCLGRYHWFYRHHEKILLIANGLLQYYYLKTYDSSFSENFYGLKRIFQDGQTLSESYRIFCAAYLSLIPYLRLKMAEKYDDYSRQEVEGCLGKDLIGQMKKILVLIYPILQTVWGSWLIINYLKYMTGKQESQLPILDLMNLKLVYSEDIGGSFWLPLFKGELRWTDFSKGVVKHTVMSLLEITAFAMQFSHSVNNILPSFNVKALPKIPAPLVDNKSSNFKEKCPLCRQYWKLPSVLPVSGYVFCFMCILKYLKEHQCCPITKLPAKPLDIIRIFDGE